jgi:hypothetical protein
MVKSRPQAVERRFIRHPSRMPISYEAPDLADLAARPGTEALRNVSDGGVCFSATQALEPGCPIRLRIPVFGRQFEIEGTVAWCRNVGGRFDIGVAFLREQDRFSARMVEQLCYIEEYRTRMEREQGRTLTSEQAAAEWVERFAGEFPELH